MYKQCSMDSCEFGGFSLLPIEVFFNHSDENLISCRWNEVGCELVMKLCGQFIVLLFRTCLAESTNKMSTLQVFMVIPDPS